jgi:hypothetical protein
MTALAMAVISFKLIAGKILTIVNFLKEKILVFDRSAFS